MSTNVGKKNIAHKGSGHGVVGPPAMSLVTPPAPPAPTPFVYSARGSNASKTRKKYRVSGKEVLVEGSTMSLDPPANQPAQSGGGDVLTHATKNIAVMTMGSSALVVTGKDVCATGDIAALNVMTAESSVAQVQMPLLEAADFEAARAAAAAAAAEMVKKWRAAPPPKAQQCTGGHPVDLGTGYVVDDAIDLSLPGHFPLVWSRSYASSRASARGALGRGGWTHSFEQWIEVTEGGYRLHDEEGLPVDFAPVGPEGISVHRGRRLELRQSGRSLEIRSLADRLIRSFSPLPGGRLALRSIRDPRLHAIELVYEGDTLVRIVDSVRRELRLTNDEKGRVTRVEVWASEPGSGAPPSLQSWFSYGYHPEGELATHTDALGHAEGWGYDGQHRMTRATLRNGVSFYYEYHPELGYCVRTWGDGGLHDVHVSIDFDKGETTTSGTNRARRYFWKGGLVQREETFGGEWAVERLYDEDELLIAVNNGLGDGTRYAYDARGNLVQETDAAGNVTRWDYHDDRPVKRIGPTGLVTRYEHDLHGSLSGVSFPTGLAYQFQLDREGRLTSVVGREGARATFTYDEHSNVCTERSTRGAQTTYRYDALGRPLEQLDALGRKSRVRYDLLGRAQEITRPDGTRVRAAYDRLGNLAEAIDPLDQVTRMAYAGTGHLARLEQADGQVYRFVYDSDERLTQIINPRLERYEFEYDRADQIIAERTFDQRLLTYRYDRGGRVVRVDHPESEWREFRHDKLGNVLEDRGEDVQIAFARDRLGRIEKAICQDLTGKVVSEFERDPFGRLVADIQNGRAVRYTYDDQGRRSTRTLPDGEQTVYHYELDDAFAGVTHEGKKISITRDPLGRERRRETRAWSLESDYDAMDRLSSQRVTAPGAGVARVLAERRYGYDAKGRLTTIESPHGGLTEYRYDRIDQLLEASRGGAREIFAYDPTGSLVNILSELGEVGKKAAWSMAPGNRLLATDKARYVNDRRGRRIQKVEREGATGAERVSVYGWDSKDRLREVALPDGSRVRLTYDAFGRRVRKEVVPPPPAELFAAPAAGRRTVSFLWDGDVLCEEQDSAKEERARKRVHVHEPGTFVPMVQAERGEMFGVVNDHLGMPKELVDETGRVAWRATHSAWGRVTGVERDPGAQEGVESPFRLLGQVEDEETGLCCTRFRYFEAGTGRWLSPDPLGVAGGMNLFRFEGSAITIVDPWGLVGEKLPDGTVVHRVGGGDASNLLLKPAESTLSPPGFSVLQGGEAKKAAEDMRAAFPKATKLKEASKTVGTATAEDIRAAGFDVVSDPTRNFPNHARVIHPEGAAGFTAENAEKLSKAFSNTCGH
jgi:RHS repeat-associated protein